MISTQWTRQRTATACLRPADDVQRLLKERPKVVRLAVPGMPASAPGMYRRGDPKIPYEVLTFQKSGTTTIYSKH